LWLSQQVVLLQFLARAFPFERECETRCEACGKGARFLATGIVRPRQQADAAQTLMFGLSTQALKEAEAVKEL
jgi:hypothetical protein